MRTHPGLVLDLLGDAAAPAVAAVKVFLGHLEPAQIDAELLGRPDLTAVVLRRRVLDCYASRLKAQAVGKWWGIDTTDVEVEGDIDEFEGWARRAQRWYHDGAAMLERRNRPLHVLTYDDELAAGFEATSAVIRRALDVDHIDRIVPPERFGVGRRQDGGRHGRARLANWDEFEADLRERGLLELATGYFL